MNKRLILMNQVHGNNVVVVGKKDIGRIIPDCDGLITNQKGVELVVQTADCLPILITDPENNVVAALHAGWRGLQRGIIRAGIDKMTEFFNTKPEDLKVEIGPHICVDHYEVKDDVSQYFPETVIKGDKKYLDLAKVAVNQLVLLGVVDKRIKMDNRCTFEDLSLSSYRGARPGRILSKISIL